MTIRSPREEDHDAWLAMRAALWPECPPDDHRAEISQFGGSDPCVAAFVAVGPDEIPLGFVEASLRPYADGCSSRPVGFIEGIHVRGDARGQGVGRALVAAAQDWAVSRGCSEMASDCLHDNESSIRFHCAVGFEIVETAVRFRRWIHPSSGGPLP
jgi:aminoglycoside 6'-N-acetyltransferase I